MIYENESGGMQAVMTRLHEFVPNAGEEEQRIFGKQGFVGDQLTVERGISTLLQMEHGFTAEERLDGLHMEIADFHAGMKFLQVSTFLFF